MALKALNSKTIERNMMFEQLGLIGCGLMGSSFALALKRAKLVKHVVGYSKSPSTTTLARKMKVIDTEAPSALQAMSGSDIVLLAIPVEATAATLKSIRNMVKPSTLIMDVGSTKCNVVAAAQRILREHMGSFVPAHPIAGKELAGVKHADVDLYTGKQIILTPTERTNLERVAQATQVWQALGCHVRQMTPEAHDAAYAAVSHLPHMLAFALMNSIQGQKDSSQYLSLAGSGFRDLTRIAGSDPKMWRDIFIANKRELLKQSHAFQQALHQFEDAIIHGDSVALENFIQQASEKRTAWQMTTNTSEF